VDLRRIYNELRVDVDSFETQLDIALRDFYIKIKFEYLESVGEIRELGLDVDAPELPDLDMDAPLTEKVQHINHIIESGRVLVKELIDTSDNSSTPATRYTRS